MEILLSNDKVFFSLKYLLPKFNFERIIRVIIFSQRQSFTPEYAKLVISNILGLRDMLPSLTSVNKELLNLIKSNGDPNRKTSLFTAMTRVLTDNSIQSMISMILKYLKPTRLQGSREPKSKQKKIMKEYAEIFAVREGHSGLLDVARQTYISLHDAIQLKFVEYENSWNNIDGLRLHNTKTRGHHLSVPIRYLRHLDDKECIEVVKRKNTVYFTTYELASLNSRKQEVFHECYQFTGEALVQLISELRVHVNIINRVMETIALLDMLHCFAGAVATDNKTFCRPSLHDPHQTHDSLKNAEETKAESTDKEEIILYIEKGRHPVLSRKIESNESDSFMPNDTCAIENDSKIQLVFGPNSSGKSTYLKQIALIVILAQSGCLVPATAARFNIFYRIHTRMTMEDDMEGNASSFLLECNEISRILSDSSENSLGKCRIWYFLHFIFHFNMFDLFHF